MKKSLTAAAYNRINTVNVFSLKKSKKKWSLRSCSALLVGVLLLAVGLVKSD